MNQPTEMPEIFPDETGQDIRVLEQDTMAEAGRKILLSDFKRMVDNEAGSRIGDDIKYVHNMRVATRRMRSAFRLLAPYYKNKPVQLYSGHLRTLAKHLGAVRDLDVMIDNLTAYQTNLPEDDQTTLQSVIDKLDKRRSKARQKLITYLDSDHYQKFIQQYLQFLTTDGKGAKPVDEESAAPHQVRHILPTLVHEHLAVVRAYDTILEGADVSTLHALRIEFKRLRYLVSYFIDVLGVSAEQFVDELKDIQDHLGHLNDTVTAQAMLNKLKLKPDQQQIVNEYLDRLSAEEADHIEQFAVTWQRFNSRTVQRKLSDALLVLR